VLPLATPTSASLDFWEAHQGDRLLFNVGLISSGSRTSSSSGVSSTQHDPQQQYEHPPVPINALDLAANSEWFRALVAHLPVLCGTDLGAVVVPCSVAREVLEHGIVRAIYGSRLALDPGSVEATYRAADAMQVRRRWRVHAGRCLHSALVAVLVKATYRAADAMQVGGGVR
jgi:hypothetical protein